MKRKFIKFFCLVLTVFSAISALQFNAYAQPDVTEPITEWAVDSVKLPSPVISSIINKSTHQKVTWDFVEGAELYTLYFLNSQNQWEALTTTGNNFFYTEDCVPGESYTYTVACVDKNGEQISEFDTIGETQIFFVPLKITSVENAQTGVCVKWESFDKAASYRVYRKIKGKFWEAVGNAEGTTYTDTTAKSNKKYYYSVRALDENGNLITYYKSSSVIRYFETPEIVRVSNTQYKQKITWNKVDGVYKYRVYRVNSDGTYTKLGDTTKTSFTTEKCTQNKIYTYTVRCFNKDGDPISSYNKEGVSAKFLAPPEISKIKNTEKGIYIKWNSISDASEYKVYRKTKNTSWKAIGSAEKNSYTDITAKSGTKYYYTVRALDENGALLTYYKSGKSLFRIAAPRVTVVNTEIGQKISWNKVNGAYKYKIYVKNSAGEWKSLKTTTGTSYRTGKLNNRISYTYTVCGYSESGKTKGGYLSDGVKFLYITPPDITSVNKTAKGNLIKWESIDIADSYKLYRKTFSGSWKKIASKVDGTSYTDTTAKANTLYAYTVRCLDKDGNHISSYIANTKFYYNGKLANGKITVGSFTYRFENGYLREGFQTIDGKKYYYNENGIVKNAIVGSVAEGWYYADSTGVCCESKDMMLAAKFVKTYARGSTKSEQLRSCFDKLMEYSYKRVYVFPNNGTEYKNHAINMFTNKQGNCFNYAAAFACIAEVLGYDARVVRGQIESAYGGLTPHGWMQIKVNDQWLICDPDMQKFDKSGLNYYMRTFEQYPVKPLVAGTTYNITISNGTSKWEKI